MLPKLPIGQQDFRKIREDRSLYVDKTQYIHRLVTEGSYYFLARPRRFGKSLLLSTIQELYSGSRELFEGLWIEDRWDWEVSHPVVHITFNEVDYKNQPLGKAITKTLQRIAASYDLLLNGDTYPELFKDLIKQLHSSFSKRVVLLIDEYDKPLIDFLTKDKISKAFEHQAMLKSFYSIIKSSDAHLHLFLITGVSKFSKVGVFSDLNNLEDISLQRKFNSLLGITQAELEHHFGEAIDEHQRETGKDDIREKLREWYNGYSFYDGSERVYNPWSLLSYFKTYHFGNFWFTTGTPTFLIDLMRERYYYEFKRPEIAASAFDSYQLDRLETVPLLFQTGYLTVKDYEPEYLLYTLDYPNREVKDSMLQYLIAAFRSDSPFNTTPAVVRLKKAFDRADLDAVRTLIDELFQTIPYQLFIDAKENLYHALIHLLFTYLGQYTDSEVSVLNGRVDAVVRTDSHVFVFEFKLDGSAEVALEQIRERGYATSQQASGKEVVAVGVNFSGEAKRVAGWVID